MFSLEKIDLLILAAGEYDPVELSFFLAQKTIFVVLDGAANTLEVHQIPDYLIGDMDSITAEKRQFYQHQTQFLQDSDQDTTDLEKGLLLAQSLKAQNILVLGATKGQRSDHFLGNLDLLKRYAHLEITLLHQGERIIFCTDTSVVLPTQKGKKAAIFGFPKAVVSSEGLVWELNNYPLEIGKKNSSCNETTGNQIMVQVEGQALLLF